MEGLKKAVFDVRGMLNNSFGSCDVTTSKLKSLGLREVELRAYQLDGVNWIISRYKNGLGCILADEMGLGKTCQTISFLVYVYGSNSETKGKKKTLIVCPLSVLNNWQNELMRFFPKVKFLSYVGDQEKRTSHRRAIESGGDDTKIILTTYEICLKDADFLGSLDWNVLVVDEAHRLKNSQSLLHLTLRAIPFEHRLLLTGTPVQNNLEELYALLSFVVPKTFRRKSVSEFVETYSDVGESGSGLATELQALIEPFILRRIKSEVLKDLPRKSEVILYHGITSLQKKYYKAVLENDIDAFDAPSKMHRTRLANVLVQLRKCVAHPYLFDGVEPEPFQLGEHLVEASGKLVVVDKLLSYLKDNGHKVLLFSQMTRVLDILQDYMTFRGYSYERLDGSVRAEERFLAVNNFNNVSDTFVFLLSTKAGGQGLNLTSADTVIFFDSDFNPQNDLQAAARAHRIGQARNVKVIRLIGRNTVEEIILRRAEDKLRLTHAVMSAKTSDASDESYKLEDIIKFGLDRLFETDDNSLEDDFATILGPTIDGQWQFESPAANNSYSDDVKEEEATTPKQIENMYVFEGKDYSKEPTAADQQAFQQLAIAVKERLNCAEASVSRTSRKKTPTVLFSALPEPISHRPKKQLTPEELEERRKQRAERAAAKTKAEEEEEIRRAQEKKERQAQHWLSNSYKSCSLNLESDDDQSTDDRDVDDDTENDDEQRSKSIHYVIGDVMHPQNTDDHDAIIVHCVDDSGRWGHGGLFTHISARSQQPEQQYKLAAKMKDLALGDVHVVPVDDVTSRPSVKDMVALMVVQHRDTKNVLSGIKLSALNVALDKLSHFAKTNHATVHMPRIGYNTPGFNWYGTERLVQKHIASQGIPTYIYYFSRRQTKRVSSQMSSDDAPSTSSAGAVKRPCRSEVPALPDFLTGVSVFFHQVPPEVVARLSRYIIAYNGDVHDVFQPDTTYVVTDEEDVASETLLSALSNTGEPVKCVVVRVEWIKRLIARQKH